MGLSSPALLKGGSAEAIYATVRRYEGVTDTSEAESLVEEGFIPTISEVPGSWLTTGLMPGTVDNVD